MHLPNEQWFEAMHNFVDDYDCGLSACTCGDLKGIFDIDPLLWDHEPHLVHRWARFQGTLESIEKNAGSLIEFAKVGKIDCL